VIHTPAELTRLIATHARWYHRIELAPGVVTPGIHDSPAALRQLDDLELPRDCAGLRALDLGCRDGFFSFELERRGAGVVAVDYTPSDETGFALAARLLGSGVRFQMENVYNLAPETYGVFDLVLFLGLLYHLRDPLRALDAIRSVCRPGARLYVESEVAEPRGADPGLPLWRFCRRDEFRGDGTTKWIPTAVGLAAALEECQFEVLGSAARADRLLVACRAVEDRDLEFYRALDRGVGAPAQPNVFWRGRRAQDDPER
jgi:tRNA (mo5U34)-methyltransferase